MITPLSEPSWAERARTALAEATVASLVTRDRHPARTLTIVAIADKPDGHPIIWLEPGSPAVKRLAVCPVVTLSVAGAPPFRSLQLAGALNPCRADHSGLQGYRMALYSVHLVGVGRLPVPVEAFLEADPDPLHRHVPEILAHLESAHAEDLLACARAHAHPARAVVPRALDRYGIELAVISEDGVTPLRLPFPGGPVADLAAIPPRLRLPLTCRCSRPVGWST